MNRVIDTVSTVKPGIKISFIFLGYLLDPHTAVAKAVLDRHNKGDCPVILASTAHYSKFSNDVLSALDPHNSDEFSSMSPQDLLNRLEDLHPRPTVHKALKDSLSQPLVHMTVCKPNVVKIKHQIYHFMDS